MTAKEFFDQFLPGLEESGVRGSSQWCARHWAACPLLHANGIGATMELMQAWLERQPGGAFEPDEMNARMDAGGPMCCQLGDDAMYEIWGHWPPSAQEATS